jgi:hypothetical protein
LRTTMLFGDAKKWLIEITEELKRSDTDALPAR